MATTPSSSEAGSGAMAVGWAPQVGAAVCREAMASGAARTACLARTTLLLRATRTGPFRLVVMSALGPRTNGAAPPWLPIGRVDHAAWLERVRKVKIVASDKSVCLGALANAVHWLTA